MAELKAKRLTLTQAEEIYDIYLKADFPPEEVKPFSAIKRMWEQEKYHAYGFYEQTEEKDTLCAYAFLMADRERRMLLLDYFAVCSHLRGSGYGTLALARLRGECADWKGILVEVEDDELPGLTEETVRTRRRRISFYTNAGCQMTTARSWLWGVDYRIMVLPVMDPHAGEHAAGKIRSVYQCMYEEKLSERYFKITAE